MLIDMHVHSTVSPCSVLTLEEILGNARRLGLDGVCITDHDSMEARKYVEEGVQPDGLLVVVGMEYETPQGDFLIFGPFESLEPGMSAAELLPLVEEAGGASIAAHPFRPNRSVEPEFILDGLCSAVEMVNGRNEERANIQAQNFFHAAPVAFTGGSDAHAIAELGLFPTRFQSVIKSRQDLIDALLAGHCSPHVAIPDRRGMAAAVGL